jgi:retron-type reverse transcriptase
MIGNVPLYRDTRFFDNLDRSHLRAFIKQRVNDGGILRLIGKWQGAGVIEDGVLHHPETGVVQGSVISPVLANVYGRLFGRKGTVSSMTP